MSVRAPLSCLPSKPTHSLSPLPSQEQKLAHPTTFAMTLTEELNRLLGAQENAMNLLPSSHWNEVNNAQTPASFSLFTGSS